MSDEAWKYQVEFPFGHNLRWLVQMQWPEGVAQGGPISMTIVPADNSDIPAGGLSQTVLRDVDFKFALDLLRQGLANFAEWDKAALGDHSSLLVEHAAEGKLSDEYLALLSEAYVTAVDTGVVRPLEHLAGVTGKSLSAIKNHLWQATRKGLLERSPGRIGGRLTSAADDLIADLAAKERERS